MANASTKEAPVNQTGAVQKTKTLSKEEAFLAQTFDPEIKYMFELAEPNMPRQLPVIDMHTKRPAPEKAFKPYRNICFTSMIIWKGQRRGVRYYDGCDSIFVDEQPKDKDMVDQFIKQTRRREFIDGKWGCHGDERMLLLFMLISSFNVESEFRTRTASPVYRPSNSAKKAAAEEEKLDLAERALEAAKNAPYSKILVHADYLGIPLKDFDSDNDLSEREIRTAYRKEALREPKGFLESYGNKALETKFYIKKALATGLIDCTTNRNVATWKSSGRKIVDINGLQSASAICDRLFEHSQLEEGEEFKIQLHSLFTT
jgi:hypothetical protein